MTINVPLMREIADAIEDQPNRYHQQAYRKKLDCGTAYCIAGWAVELADNAAWCTTNVDVIFGCDKVNVDGGLCDIQKAGADLLGLDRNTDLFSADWRPAKHLTVPDALRKYADNENFEEITGWFDDHE